MAVEKKDIDWGQYRLCVPSHRLQLRVQLQERCVGGRWPHHRPHPDAFRVRGHFPLLPGGLRGPEGLHHRRRQGRLLPPRPQREPHGRLRTSHRDAAVPRGQVPRGREDGREGQRGLGPAVRLGATLYIRPFMVATGEVIGVAPADEYQFRILVTPVGPYYSGGVKPVAVKVPEYDRAAPHGTGAIKAGLNYAMSLYPSVQAHAEGFADNMFLDPQTHTFVEESGGANFCSSTRTARSWCRSPRRIPSCPPSPAAASCRWRRTCSV